MNKVTFEWCVEYTDEYGDIIDLDFGKRLGEVWPPRSNVYKPTLCHVRCSGNDKEGETDRGYAYAGDKRYTSGQKVRDNVYHTLIELAP
jgi:hypothetical protein